MTFKYMMMLVSMTLFLMSCGQSDQTGAVLKFTAIPDQNTTELSEKFAPLSEYLAKTLNVTVVYVPVRDYQASVELFKNGDVHLAWFGGLTGVQARASVPGARAIAQGAADPQYYSYFIAHADTGLQRSDTFPQEMADLSFIFGSESSTSGRLMPQYFIEQATGKSPTEFFGKAPVFSGSHDKTAELVNSGQFKAGVLNYKVYDKLVAQGKLDPEVCRVIWQTPTYADYNWTAHSDLETQFGTGFLDKLQAVLTGIEDPSLLQALPRERLIPAANKDYGEIERVARSLGMLGQ